jgi:SAM-dependent methyltransferase
MAEGRQRPASRIDHVLTDEEDAFGLLLLDFLTGAAEEPFLERDDGYAGPALGADCFFAPYGDWPKTEQTVFDLAEGRVLDVGCGAGRHSLEAQKRGLEVVAIDISPGALAVSARRGVRDVRPLPLAGVDDRLGRFDTILTMCGNFGLVGTASECRRVFRVLHGMTTRTARIILDTVDPYDDNDAADLTYQEHNRARGRMAGQVTIRIRYRERGLSF